MKEAPGRLAVAVASILVVMYVVPFPIYGAFEAFGAVEVPEGASVTQFLLSVLVIKVGVALAFVALFRLARATLAGRWWLYAAIWWLMYAIVEIGQAIGPGYSAAEAVAGIISEAIYFPLSSAIVARLLASRRDAV